MQKPNSLRAAITLADPELGRDPGRLHMWVEKGGLRAPMTASHSFAVDYNLSIIISDFAGHPSVIFLAINQWLRVNQPDLLAPGANSGYQFQADILDNNLVDIQIDLPLTEQVIVTPATGGGWQIEHAPEPDPLFDDDTPLSTTGATLRAIWSPDGQIA